MNKKKIITFKEIAYLIFRRINDYFLQKETPEITRLPGKNLSSNEKIKG
jgi:hypothetical protein